MSFRVKLFIIFIMFGIILTAFTQILILNFNQASIKEESLHRAHSYAAFVNKNFSSYIQNISIKLDAISESEILQENIEKDDMQALIASLFMDITKTSQNIMQLRFIDSDGDEIIRIDRENVGTTPYEVQGEDLQNKKDRYYFQKIFLLDRGQYWYSKLDLNVEHGDVENPIKPVLRVGTPLFHGDKKIGILIVNIFMKEFLQTITNIDLYHVYIVDKDGYILVEPTHTQCWSRYIRFNVKKYTNLAFYKDKDKILKKDEYYGKGFYATKLDLNNGENLKLIVVPNNSNLESKIKQNDKELIIIFITVMLLAFPLSYFISIIPAKLKNKVDKLNENLRQEAKEKDILLSLFDLSNTVLFKWNNDVSWSVNFVSKSVNSLLEYSKDDFETNTIAYSDCIHPDDIEQVTQELEEAIEKGEYFFKHLPYRVVTKSKKIKWILDQTVIVRNDQNEIINFVGYLLDITEIKEREIELKVLARTDQLTKIYNRVYLDEVLHNQYYRYKRNQEACSIILLDIDFFKDVNDEYGHIVGDKVLIEFAQLLEESVRDGDIVGRWGGEEFLIVLPHTLQSQAVILAEKLRKKIETHQFGVVVHKTASFGVCAFSDETSIEKLIDKADKALYEAKKSGRNKVVSCHLLS